MPYNILLLPLLAGFLLIARARVFSYATSQLQKEQLLLWASLTGLLLLVASRILCISLADTVVGIALIDLKQSLAPFPYMGTAVGTLLLSCFTVVALNCLVPETEAGLWLFHSEKFSQLEITLLTSVLGVSPAGRMSYARLLQRQLKLDGYRFVQRMNCFLRNRPIEWNYSCFEEGDPQLVMVSLRDNKIYVGLVAQLPPVFATQLEYLRILPVWSGYRDAKDRRVYRTTDYSDALLDENDRQKLIKVLPTKDVAAIGLYVDGTFPDRHDEQIASAPRIKNAEARSAAHRNR